jgi:hypothetical protein
MTPVVAAYLKSLANACTATTSISLQHSPTPECTFGWVDSDLANRFAYRHAMADADHHYVVGKADPDTKSDVKFWTVWWLRVPATSDDEDFPANYLDQTYQSKIAPRATEAWTRAEIDELG